MSVLSDVPIIGPGLDNLTGGGQQATNSQVPLDSQSQGLLNQGVATASQTPQQFAAQSNQGMNAAADSFNPSAAQNASASQQYGGPNDGYVQALRNQYASSANKSIEQMKVQNGYNGEMQKAQQLQAYSQAALGQQAANNSFNAQITQNYQQMMQARAGLVGSLFQTGALAGGMAMKGGGAPSASAQDANEWNQASAGSAGMAPPNPY